LLTKINIILFILLSSIFISGCQGSLNSYSIGEIEFLKNYPYKIYAKTTNEIAVLQAEFDSLNKNRICTVLDQFGFTDDAHCQEEIVEENLIDQKKIVSLVKSTLVKNSKFTNVLDTSDLKVNKFDQVGISPFHNSIDFKEQVVEDLTIEESRIIVFFYGNYVYQIHGSWYPEIPIPPKEYGHSIFEAKYRIIGKKFEYSCWTKGELTITWQSIMDEYTERCIYPIISDSSIEFRHVYRFTISRGNPQRPDFHIYVDIITGEIIKFIQLFRC
jgi:hypothetical protein